MRKPLPLALLLLSLSAAPGCDKISSLTGRADAAQLSVESRQTLEKRSEKLVSTLIEEAFKDPEVDARMDAMFGKLFASPDVEGAMQGLVQTTMGDAESNMGPLMEGVMKDAAVLAKLQELIAGTTDPGEIERRIGKHVEAGVGSPEVEKAIEHGVEKLLDSPEVHAKLGSIFSDPRFVPSIADDKTLLAQSADFDARLAKAQSAGKVDEFLDGWEKAVRADEGTRKKAKALLMTWLDTLEHRDDLKAVIKGGLESPRTGRIFGAALKEILADEAASKSAGEVFKALMLGTSNETTATKVTAFLEHPKFVGPMRKAILELLSSEKGAEALGRGFLAALREEAPKKKLSEFVGSALEVKVAH